MNNADHEISLVFYALRFQSNKFVQFIVQKQTEALRQKDFGLSSEPVVFA